MCSQTASLKVIALTCLCIMCVDAAVLYQTILQWVRIKESTIPEVYETCFEPQLIMRVIFTGYAINAATLCFLLTLSLAFFSDQMVEQFA